MKNLFGESYEDAPRKEIPSREETNKKRRWEDAFQKWSNEHGMSGLTHYGACGYGAICDYCKDNHIGRPCVRALNEMLRTKRSAIDYDAMTFEEAFDGEIKHG